MQNPNNMVSDNTPPDPRQEILEYLSKHPHAADTVDGIILYWLSRQRYETAQNVIEKALDDLVKGGIIESVSTGTEKKVFRLVQDQKRLEPSKKKQKSDQ